MFRFLRYALQDGIHVWSDALGLHKGQRPVTRGITLLYLLIQLIIMHIMLALALPSWDAWVQREKELELIWRGEQYVQAINYYYLKYRSYPPSIDLLVQQHFLRKAYPDPFGPDGKWNILTQISQGQAAGDTLPSPPPGQGREPSPGQPAERPTGGTTTLTGGGIIGVVSLDEGESIIVYKNQRQHNLWRFVFIPQQVRRQPIQQPRPPGQTGNVPARSQKPSKPP